MRWKSQDCEAKRGRIVVRRPVPGLRFTGRPGDRPAYEIADLEQAGLRVGIAHAYDDP